MDSQVTNTNLMTGLCLIIMIYIEEFGLYLQYTRNLDFEESPNYDYLRGLFDKVLSSLGEIDDGVYDWMLLNDGKGWEVRSTVEYKMEVDLIFLVQYRSNLYRNIHHKQQTGILGINNSGSNNDRSSRQVQSQQKQRRLSNKRYGYKASQPMLAYGNNIVNYCTMDSTHQLLLHQQQQHQQQDEDSNQKKGFFSKCFGSICFCL